MTVPEAKGTARFVGTVPNHHDIFRLLYSDSLELYELNPPLGGYRIVAAGQGLWAMRAVAIGEPEPANPEDPVRTTLFGTAGGEGLQIVWEDKLFEVGGKAPARALAEIGYQVKR